MRTMLACFSVITVLSSSIATACSCTPVPPVKTALARSRAVFAGTVKKLERSKDWITVTVEISRRWKGDKRPKLVTVRTGTNDGNCGYKFQVGTAYLIYCPDSNPKSKPTEPLETSICTRTKPLAKAKADLKELGKGSKP